MITEFTPLNKMEFPAPIEIKEEKLIFEYDIKNIFDNHYNIDVKVECDEVVVEENDWCIQNVINNEANYRCSVIDYDELTEYCVQRCQQCYMKFTNCHQLIQHNITHMNVHLHKPSYFQCSECNKIFLLRFKLSQHIKVKHHHHHLVKIRKRTCISKMDRKCEICQKMLSYRSWHGHLREVHGERKYNCKKCGYQFKAARYLKRHILKIHERIQVNKLQSCKEVNEQVNCALCSTVSRSKLALKMHMKNCHSEKSYDCDLCIYTNSFKSLPYLRCHLRRQHKFKAKEYTCDVCKKTFKWLQLLNIHIKDCH